jgi:hypothetical protein
MDSPALLADTNRPDNVVSKNIILTGKVTKYLIEHPSMLESLPENFVLVVLPEDDRELSAYNLELLAAHDQDNKPVVFACLRAGNYSLEEETPLAFYAPVPA